MKKLLGFWLSTCLSLALVHGADPIPKSPDGPAGTVTIEAVVPVSVPVGKKLVIDVKTTAKKVTWVLPEGVEAIALDGKRLAVWALPGTYKLLAQVPNGDEVVSSLVEVTITGDVGPPPPVSTLNRDVRLAYDRDTTEALVKASLLSKLAKLYRASASDAFLKKYGATTTWYEVFQDISTANGAQMAQTDLQGVRTVIQKHLDARLPVDRKTVLDPKLAAAEFGAVAAALEAAGK